MQVVIREQKESDIPELEQLFLVTRRETFTHDPPEKVQLADFTKMTATEKVFVAEAQGKVVGFISLYVEDKFIHNLYVLAEWQNKGIGKKLLKKAVEVAPPPLELKAVLYNTRACKFYEKQGFKKIATNVDGPEPHHVYRLG